MAGPNMARARGYVRRLDRLCLEGQGESPAARAILDAIETELGRMTDDEARSIRDYAHALEAIGLARHTQD